MSLFDLVAGLLLILTAVAVVTLRNAVHAALALAGNFLVLAAVYMALDARFLGWIQVIVYAGAIMVLFLFVIMLLLAARADTGVDPVPSLRPFAGVVGVLLLVGLGYAVTTFEPVQSLVETAPLLAGGTAQVVGEALYGPWLYAVELIAVLLLAATVAAVVMVQPEVRRPRVKPQVAERERELEEVTR